MLQCLNAKIKVSSAIKVLESSTLKVLKHQKSEKTCYIVFMFIFSNFTTEFYCVSPPDPTCCYILQSNLFLTHLRHPYFIPVCASLDHVHTGISSTGSVNFTNCKNGLPWAVAPVTTSTDNGMLIVPLTCDHVSSYIWYSQFRAPPPWCNKEDCLLLNM